MSFPARLRAAVADPVLVWYRLRGSLDPAGLRRRYQRLARGQGFRRAYFLLSFDCDTDRDIAVAELVHGRLQKLGVTPVYAVPGELLQRGAKVYRTIADSGAEFINHGYREHTIFDPVTDQYVSTVFYHRLTPEAVAEDVRRGDAIVSEVLGRRPIGFRTPHFGTYRGRRRLEWLHGVLAGLGYRFSTSTEPALAMRLGPAPTLDAGLKEFPVTGCYDAPFRILDSLGFRFAPGRRDTASEFMEQAKNLGDHFTVKGHVGLGNSPPGSVQAHD